MTTIITVQQAVYPLLLTCSILGIGIYSPNKFYLNILYNLTVWISYGCLYYYIITVLKVEVWFQSYSSIAFVRIGILVTITSIVMSIYQDKKFRLFMKRLAAVDDTLEKLGTPKIYQKLHTYAKRVLIVWFVCSYVVNVFEMIWWFYIMKDNHQCVIIPFITNHIHHVNMLMDLLFITFLWYIGTRFDKINERMKYLIIKGKYELRYSSRKTVPMSRRSDTYINYEHILWISMHLHLELCQIARELNTVFGPQITMEMVAYLVNLTRVCCYIYMHIQTKGRYIPTIIIWYGMFFWIVMYLARLYSINYICEKISDKANETEKIIHRLTDFRRYADFRQEVYQFSMQIIHHPLKFTGLGLFYFGNSLVQKCVITIAKFLIIIIQMSSIPKRAVDF